MGKLKSFVKSPGSFRIVYVWSKIDVHDTGSTNGIYQSLLNPTREKGWDFPEDVHLGVALPLKNGQTLYTIIGYCNVCNVPMMARQLPAK